ncbi:glycosyltransferase [Aeromonas sp. s12]|uniref:glycosyltransferase n=1 Tax=Aeromonas sp. s12 TaxID=3138482 RepID=UPI0034A2D551
MQDKMKFIMIFTSWYPNDNEPNKCVFTKNILTAQVKLKKERFVLVVPRPYIPNFKFIPQKIRRYSNLKSYEHLDGIDIYRPTYLRLPFFKKLNHILLSFAMIRFVRNVFKNEVDIIHSHGMYPDAFISMKLSKRLNIPLVCHVHDSYLNKVFDENKNEMSLVLQNASSFIAVSEYQKRTLISLGANEEKIDVIYNGVFHTDIINQCDSLNRFIFIGNLIPVKGVQILIDAVKILKDKNVIVRVDIVGDGHCRSHFINKVKELGLENQIDFRGVVPNEDIQKLICHYNGLILPSLYETFGIVLIEALSVGTPVIASDTCAIPEIVKNYGLLFKPGDPIDLAEKIECFMSHKWEPNKIKSYGMNYSLWNLAEGISGVYNKI